MIVYLLLFFSIIIFYNVRIRIKPESTTLIAYEKKFEYKKQYVILISTFLVMIIFLKHDMVGNDTHSYRVLYDSICREGNISYIFKNQYILGNGMEISYLYLLLLFARLHIPFRIMMLAFAIFYFSAIGILIYRYSDTKWLSSVILILMGYLYFFTANRQALALALTVFSFLDLQDEKHIRSYVVAFIACLMHTSAIAYLLFLILRRVKWKKWKIVLLSVLIIMLFLQHQTVTNLLLFSIGREAYVASEAGGVPIIIISILIVMLGYVYMKNIISTDKMMMQLYTMMIVCLLTMPFCIYNPFFYRLRHYFAVYMIVFVPNIMHRVQRNKIIPIIVILAILVYGSYVFFGIGQKFQSTRSFPYVFCWDTYPAELISKFTSNVHLEPMW